MSERGNVALICTIEFSFPATLPTMDGGPLLVNDFLSHSEKIFIGEGPESIEELNGGSGVRRNE